jgi:flagellar biogenesis protein FliO
MEAALTLLFVGLIGAAVVSLLRRTGSTSGNGGLELYGRLSLDARKAIFLVKVGDQVLVLGSSEAGLRLLTTVPACDLPAPQVASSSLIQNLIGKLNAVRAHDDLRKAARSAEPPEANG